MRQHTTPSPMSTTGKSTSVAARVDRNGESLPCSLRRRPAGSCRPQRARPPSPCADAPEQQPAGQCAHISCMMKRPQQVTLCLPRRICCAGTLAACPAAPPDRPADICKQNTREPTRSAKVGARTSRMQNITSALRTNLGFCHGDNAGLHLCRLSLGLHMHSQNPYQ